MESFPLLSSVQIVETQACKEHINQTTVKNEEERNKFKCCTITVRNVIDHLQGLTLKLGVVKLWETTKYKLHFDPPKPLPQEEGSASLSSLSISNYLMSNSHVRESLTL